MTSIVLKITGGKLQTDLVVKKFIGLDPVMSQVFVGK